MKTKLTYLLAAVMLCLVHAAAQNPLPDQLRKRASAGDFDAQMRMAVAAMTGDGIDKNEEQGFYWLSKAAGKGNPEALYHLGVCYLLERGVSCDIQKGLEYVTRAAETGFAPAQTYLGLMYRSGRRCEYLSECMKYLPYALSPEDTGEFISNKCFVRRIDEEQVMPADKTLAVEWLAKAVARNELDAMYALAWMYLDGEEIEPDRAEGCRLMRLAAEGGMAFAMTQLADWYKDGYDDVIEPGAGLAFEWYGRAADCGDAEAMCRLAEYYSGEEEGPVEPDPDKMVEWYRKAAECVSESYGFDILAQNRLGYIYKHGSYGVRQDIQESLKWWRMAAERGDAYAQCQLAFLYGNEEYGVANSGKALFWLKKSADGGNEYALGMLGLKYFDGDGVDKDDKLGFKYTAMSVEKGSTTAMIQLAKAYWYGRGCAVDQEKAIDLCVKAGDKGDAGGYGQAAVYYSRLADRAPNRKAKQALQQYCFTYYEKAARMDNAEGQFRLARAYADGIGCKPNLQMYRFWLKKAADQGHQEAMELYDKLQSASQQTNIFGGGMISRMLGGNQ